MKIIREDIPQQSHNSFECFEYLGQNFNCPYHVHPEVEITLIVSGRGHRLTGDHFAHFEPGDLVIHGSNLPHHYQKWDNETEPAHSFYIQFNQQEFRFLDLPEFHKIKNMLSKADRGLYFSLSKTAGIQEIIKAIYAASGPSRISKLIDLLEKLSKVRETHQLASVGYHNSPDNKTTQRLERVIVYLEESYSEKISLKKVAEIACLHPQSFSRFFSQQMGKSFQNYLAELRLSHATRELLNEDKTITEIAFDSGFSNLSNFNRLFKRHYGESPSEYLKRVRQ